MIFALLLGRKGSVGFPNKNYFPVLGRPLCYYPMKAALDSTYINGVYLSTDDEVLMEIAGENSVEVIVRPHELCTREALADKAFIHGYREIQARNRGEDVEILVLLMCNAPIITPRLIDAGITALRENPDCDSAVSVSKYNMWSPLRARKIGDDGLLHPFVSFKAIGNPNKLSCDRDSQGDVWFADMGVSIIRPRCLEQVEEGLLPQKWMGKKIYPLRQWGGLDVDYEWQIPQVEFWLKNNGYSEGPEGQ